MSTDTTKVKAKLAALVASFDDLEAQLEPLFAQTLPETLVGLEPLQQAKLQTVLPYLVYDLIFIYLKSRGIDPRTHPVVAELDRIRQYFEKISNAENPPAKRAELDKAAAGRFIKHAIAQSQWKKTAAEEMQDNDSASLTPQPKTVVPVKETQKMRERAEYEKKVKEEDMMQGSDDENEGLEVFEDEGEGEADESTRMDVDVNKDVKGKGKQVASAPDVKPSNKNKRRRAVLDPFAGYGDDAVPSTSAGFKKIKSSSPSPPPTLLPQTTTTTTVSTFSTPTTSETSKAAGKKSKKKSKK